MTVQHHAAVLCMSWRELACMHVNYISCMVLTGLIVILAYLCNKSSVTVDSAHTV
jgi:hypothetical protein